MDEALTELGMAFKRMQARHQRAGNEALESLGITIVQWDALRNLHRHPGASLHDLAVLTFQTDQSFGPLANRMVERGLIERVPGAGRAVRHRITEHGEAVRTEAQRRVESMLRTSLSPLEDDERRVLGELLTKLTATSP